MEKICIILFIGFSLFGMTLSQFENSGDDGEDESHHGDEDEFDEEEESGDNSLLTACQKMKGDYSQTQGKYEPVCLPNGQFAPRQCDQALCWCVDQLGLEIPGTKGISDCDAYADTDLVFEDTAEVKTLGKENVIFYHPGVLAGVIGGIIVCLLCAVLVVMFIVYRMKKKDEGSYILGRAERKNSRSVIYTKAVPRDQEFYA